MSAGGALARGLVRARFRRPFRTMIFEMLSERDQGFNDGIRAAIAYHDERAAAVAIEPGGDIEPTLIRIRHGHHRAALAALLKLTDAERDAAVEEQARRRV